MKQAASHTDALLGLGKRLCNLRQAKGMSLSDLAAASGVPASTISKIENRLLNPSLVHAINLAKALDGNLGFLMGRDGERDASFSLVRQDQRQALDLPEMSLVLQDVHGGFATGVLEARVGIIAPDAHSGEEPMHHDGEEFCYVLEGGIRYIFDTESHDLGPGDSIQFKCSDRHRWVNSAQGTTKVLWVFSDGLSF